MTILSFNRVTNRYHVTENNQNLFSSSNRRLALLVYIYSKGEA